MLCERGEGRGRGEGDMQRCVRGEGRGRGEGDMQRCVRGGRGGGGGRGHAVPLAMFFSSPAHFLKIWRDCPECNIPGVANTT